MIVKCEQCQTRFKIPDEKVTDKGVKVRCTKCQHTFRVKREGAVDAAQNIAPGPAPAVDPFARFATGAEPNSSEATRPAFVPSAEKKSGATLAPSFAAQSSLPPQVFHEPTLVRKVPSAAPAKSEPAPFDFSAPAAPGPAPFDFSSLPPPAAAPAAPPPRAPPAVAPKPSSYEPAPFDFSVLDSPPSAPAAAPPRPAPARAEPQPSAYEPQPFDFSALDAPPAPAAPATRAATAAVPTSPFDFAAPAPPAPKPVAKAPPPKPPPAKAPSVSASPAAKAPAVKAAPPPAAAAPMTGLFGAESASDPPSPFDFGPPPPASASSSAPTNVAAAPPAPEPFDFGEQNAPPQASSVSGLPGAGLLGDLGAPDPFGIDVDADMSAEPTDRSNLSGASDDGLAAAPSDRRSLFDMSDVPAPPPEAPAVPQAPPITEVSVPVARIALKRVTADGVPVSAAQAPSSDKRRVARVVLNTLSAAALLGVVVVLTAITVNDGKLDASSFTWARLKAAFSGPAELMTFDISNGLYQTRVGRPVFYVRGEVKNRGAAASRIRVKAEILDGDDLVRSAEGWAGASPSPEDLFGIATADELDKLSQRLVQSAAELPPGEQASFLITFYEYPPELRGFRVKVTAASGAAAETAAR